jgi:hypothetical protein
MGQLEPSLVNRVITLKKSHFMQTEKEMMKYENMLPSNFDGTFRFTNPSDEDFIGRWNSKEYLFPAKSTVPLLMPEHSPLEIQYIRKKFARDLAEREFYRSKSYQGLAGQEGTSGNRVFSGIHQAATYTWKDLVPYIDQCLTSLPEKELRSKQAETVRVEDKLHTNDDGNYITEAISPKASLRAKAQTM